MVHIRIPGWISPAIVVCVQHCLAELSALLPCGLPSHMEKQQESELSDPLPHRSPSQMDCTHRPQLAVEEPEVEDMQDQLIVRQQDEIIINTVYTDQDPWDSDAESISSTPGFKHGRHSDVSLESLAKQEVKQECAEFLARQRSGTRRGPSVHLLADSRVEQWSLQDKVCLVDYHAGWTFKTWIAALRAETVRITANNVILYLEKTQEFDDVPPIKNALHTMCRTIRQHNHGTRIFITNLLPRVSGSPVQKSVPEANFILLQAVRSVNRALGKVHFLSLYKHFTSAKTGRVIKWMHRFFMENNIQLTPYGCMVMRECLLREAGLKSYWFK